MKETYMVKAKVRGDEVWFVEAGRVHEFDSVACALDVCNKLLAGEGVGDAFEVYGQVWPCEWVEVHSVTRLRHIS